MTIKRFVSIILTVMMLMMCVSMASAEETIIIGNIAPMTGALAAYGTAVDNGIRLAASEINAAGGVLGSKIEVVTKDNQFTPAEAISGFNALLSKAQSPSSALLLLPLPRQSPAPQMMRASC